MLLTVITSGDKMGRLKDFGLAAILTTAALTSYFGISRLRDVSPYDGKPAVQAEDNSGKYASAGLAGLVLLAGTYKICKMERKH